jgi:hypothetical protein
MANNRLEELRQRAQERIQQVRESMERGEDVAQSAPPVNAPPPPPPPAERSRESTTRDAYQVGPQSLEGPSLEGRSLEVPGYETQRTQLEATFTQTLRPSSFSEGPQRRVEPATAGRRGRRSRAAKVLNKDSLRQAMLVVEILGKPVSERPTQGLGNL